jgi:phage terminase large subunit-like protein
MEYHLHKTSEMYDVMNSGMGARTQSLMFIITTAGFDLNNPCYRVEYEYVQKILNTDIDINNDRYLIVIAKLDEDDDIKDENNWIKANPILATYKEGLQTLRDELKIALEVPEKMRDFLTKRMNIWINQSENGYMDMKKWKTCKRDIDFESLKGKDCYVGIDLSSKIDLTSVAFNFPMDNDEYVILSHSFMPEDQFNIKLKTDKVPYDLWRDKGYITVTDGAVVDYSFVENYIVEMENKFGFIIREICFDPWNAYHLATNLDGLGYEMVEIRQGYKTMAYPTKQFRESVYQGKIIHDDNPVLNWAMSNARTRVDANENFMLDKSKTSERIDPAVAVIISHVRAVIQEHRLVSVYESRGIRSL